MPTSTPDIASRTPTSASPSQSCDVVAAVPHIAREYVVHIVHLVDNLLRWVRVEDSVQVAMCAELFPHREPGLAFWWGEHAGTFPEVATFVEGYSEKEGGI